MEKQKFTIDYSGSGVRSLRFLSWVFIIGSIVGGVMLLLSFKYLSSYSTTDNIIGSQLLYGGICLMISGLVFSITFRAFATIAENSLYQNIKLKIEIEKEFEIRELPDK